nr:hypothetical protein [Tanacetum cinerariifolium]
MHKAFPLPVMEFPLSEEVPTASEESSYCQKKKDATAKKIALLLKSSSNCQSKSYDSYAKLVPYVSPCILGITVIEFGDSDEAPADNPTTGSASDGSGKKKGRTITLTTDDMQKRKNDVKARTTLLLSLPDEHQLRFSKYKTAQELWAAILKTFSGNEATKKTKKNLLKQKSDLDTMSLDDLCNYLKVYESEVQKKSEPNSQNMAFISSAKHSSGNEETSIQGTDVAGFNKSKVECFNFHKMGYFARECRAPRSQDRERRDNYRQGSKVEEQAPKALMAIDGVGWDWSYMANDEENHALITDEETPTEFALMAKTSAESDNMIYHYKLRLEQVEARLAEHKNQELKYCKKIRVLELKTESRANCIKSLTKDLELLKKEKGELESKLTGFQTASKDLDSLLESQRLDKNKEGLGYSDVSPPPA